MSQRVCILLVHKTNCHMLFLSQHILAERTMTFSEILRLSGMQRMLLLYVVLPLIIVVGLGLGVGLERLNSQESERLKDDLELIGRAISLPISEALVAGDEEAVRRTLQSIFAIGRVYGASVFDAD